MPAARRREQANQSFPVFAAPAASALREGSVVTISWGLFAGTLGVIESLDDVRVVVKVSLAQRSVRVELDTDMLAVSADATSGPKPPERAMRAHT